MTTTRENFETNPLKSNKYCLLLFFLLLTNISFAKISFPNDTIRIDGRLVVIEKEEVKNLEELPQEDFKEKRILEKYLLSDFSWGISPYGMTTVSPSYHQINEFIKVKNKSSLDNFSLGIKYGVLLKSNWFFEGGFQLSHHSFNTTSFDTKELLDSNINQVDNYTFEGFIEQDQQLFQYAFEHFNLGPEERIKPLTLLQDKNTFWFFSIPVFVGRKFDLTKKTALNIKTGFLNTFVISSDFSTQYMVNSTNEFVVLEDTKFKKYIPELAFESGLSFKLPAKPMKIYSGIYGIIPLNDFSVNNDYFSITKSSFGLKIGIIVNLF